MTYDETTIPTLRANLDRLNARDRAFADDLIAAADLCARKGWEYSAGRAKWAAILAARATGTEPARPTAEIGDLTGVLTLFGRAKEHLKRPAIVLHHDGQDYRLSEAGQRARVPGSINVAEAAPFGEGKWFGRILRDGTFTQSREELPAGLVELIREFAREPAKVAARHGRLTGKCCFCNRALTDERSTAVGYGATCASHFAMPYPTLAEARAVHTADLEAAA